MASEEELAPHHYSVLFVEVSSAHGAAIFLPSLPLATWYFSFVTYLSYSPRLPIELHLKGLDHRQVSGRKRWRPVHVPVHDSGRRRENSWQEREYVLKQFCEEEGEAVQGYRAFMREEVVPTDQDGTEATLRTDPGESGGVD